ncbi:ankyrin repeat-containing domain protein [Podospora fimiseda]|uniref:Ankyrin repeat-containing domain protein n=1 Tax=Podospora fimiseda TaxID=252190 RepID=A0AAN7BST2_9PEZI|nr:ankyrin repeat-containing domain protein [Podospora fimiseda]
MAWFSHSSIDLSTDAIRLLRLFKGIDGDPIRCEIFQTFLHEVDGVPYEAVSYTWGNIRDQIEITMNDQRAKIGTNLYLFLCSLRQPSEDNILWVDAICIDQENDREKGHQVRQMGQIYAKAQNVQIWLGPATDDTDFFINRMNELDERVLKRVDYRRNSPQAWFNEWPAFLEEMEQHSPDSNFITRGRRALIQLFKRPWFQRVWIIQEVFNAKRAVIRCGLYTVPTRTFVMAPWLVRVEIDTHIQAVLDIMPGYLRATSWWRDRPNLETLLNKFRKCKATDPRDKIYALIGIASDTGSQTILEGSPYEVSETQAVCATVRYLLVEQFPDAKTSILRTQTPSWDVECLFSGPHLSHLPLAVLTWAVDYGLTNVASYLLERTDFGLDSTLFTIEDPGLLSVTDNFDMPEMAVESILGRGGADIGSENKQKNILCIAARKGDIAMVACLLDHAGAGMEVENGETLAAALSAALQEGHDSVGRLLLERGAQVNQRSSTGEPERTPLYVAANKGHASIVEFLVSLNTPQDRIVNAAALRVAAHQGHSEVVSVLLRSDAFQENDMENQATLLLIACKGGPGHMEIAQLALDAGADPLTMNDQGFSALCISCKHGCADIVRILLERGANVDTIDSSGTSVLWISCFYGRADVVRILLDAGADPNQTIDEKSPLWIACQEGHYDVVSMLISVGADATMAASGGRTPLWIACKSGHTSIIEILLERGADVNTRTTDGKSALWIACYEGHDDVVRILIEAGADINTATPVGTSAFEVASRFTLENSNTARLLLEAGVDVNAAMSDGCPLLCRWSEKGNATMVKLLLKAGANLEARDRLERTALWLSSKNGLLDMVLFLLSEGADIIAPGIVDYDSDKVIKCTPEDIAREHRHFAVAEVLRSKAKAMAERRKRGPAEDLGSSTPKISRWTEETPPYYGRSRGGAVIFIQDPHFDTSTISDTTLQED